MESMHGKSDCQRTLSNADLQWFFAKSKVSISLAIDESSTFLDGLQEAGILSEEESLELQADTRSDDQVAYDCLCCIEEKDFSLQTLFEHLFQRPNLKKYPRLKPTFKDYRNGRFQNKTEVSTDVDKDRIIFAQDKVKICLAITHIFPFVHGLQDLTLLSETESLKLQADKRPVSRVIYECLSLIEKKDLKLNVVFEYIFQESYLRRYPCLQDILQEPSSWEHAGLFNGQQYPVFSNPNDLKNFFEQSKSDICQCICEQFPFLHGLHDLQLLSRLQLLRLQADKTTTKDVLYKALCQIRESRDIETFFVYTFRPFFLAMFPSLQAILQRLNEALREDACPLPTGSYEKKSRKIKPALEQATSAGHQEHRVPEVGPAKKERSHKHPSITRLPEKRSMTDEVEDNKIKIYRCDYEDCTMASTDRSEFKVHRRKHKEERPYFCSFQECERRFDCAERLARHLLKHTGIKSYRCPKM